jgi:1-acyl-sn-glycerol-3-phosphate acyltransferase
MLKKILLNTIIILWCTMWIPLIFIGLISAKLERKLILLDARGALFLIRHLFNIRYKIHYPLLNEDGIPFQHNINQRFDGRAIIASKHMSMLEVLILLTHVPNVFFIMKRELLWIPIYGWAFARIGLIGVNRKRGATNMHELATIVMEKVMKGMTLVIFPEGTRVAPGERPQLKRGLLYLAQYLKLPILPVGVDTGLYWPKHGKIKSGTAHIYFENELPSTATLNEISDAINNHSC